MATVHILGEGGSVFEMDLPLHETIEDKLRKGYLRRVNADGTPFEEGSRPLDTPSLPTSRPAINAVKAEWVGWAVVQGVTPDDAEAMTKQDLIDKYGMAGAEAEAEAPVEEPAPAEESPEAS